MKPITKQDGGKLDITITRHQADNFETIPGTTPDEFKDAIELYRSQISGNDTSIIQEAANRTGMDYTTCMFLHKLYQFQNHAQAESEVREWEDRLGEVDDKNLQSLVVELVQNAIDIEATELHVTFVGDDQLTFTHNGGKWTPEQLRAVDSFFSTKRGDIRSIGQFGVGLKYWFHHFKEFHLSYVDEDYIHRLTIHRTHNPSHCKYHRCQNTEQDRVGQTQFGFSGLKDDYSPESRSLFEDMRTGRTAILSNRVMESMPNLMRSGAEGIRVNYTTLEPDTTTSLQLEMGESLIHRVEGEQTVVKMADFMVQGGEATKNGFMVEVNLHALCSALGEFGEEFESGFKVFSEVVRIHLHRYAISSIRKSAATEHTLTNEELVDKFASSMLEQLTIKFSLFRNDEGRMQPNGYPSQLFVASNVDDWDHPFSVDGPWKLTQDRLQLHFEAQPALDLKLQSRYWNSKLSFLIERAYAWVMGQIVESNCLSFSLDEIRLLFHQFPAVSLQHMGYLHHNRPAVLKTMDGDVFTEILPDEMMGGSADAPDEFVELWSHLAMLEDTEALLWLSEALHNNIAHINLQDGIKVPLQLGKLNHPEFAPVITQNYGEGVPEPIIEWFGDNPNHGWMLARTGRIIGQEKLQFLDERSISILAEGSEDTDAFGPFTDLLHLLPDSDGKDYATIEESQLESIGLRRPSYEAKEIGGLYDDLVKHLFDQSSSYSEELETELLNIILQNKPNTLEKGYIIAVGNDNEVYRFEIPSENHVLGVLIGDNQGARIHEMKVRPEENTNRGRVILGKELSIHAWGSDTSDFSYTFFFDRRYEWWNELFGVFPSIDKDSDLLREGFGVHDYISTVELSGWLACDTGLDDLNCQELHKRLRPFTVNAFVPFSRTTHWQIDELPAYALQRGLRKRDGEGSIKNENGFQPIGTQQREVDRQIFDTPRVWVQKGERLLGLNLELKKRVMGVSNNRVYVCPRGYSENSDRIIIADYSVNASAIVTINAPESRLSARLDEIETIEEKLTLHRHWRTYRDMLTPPEGTATNSSKYNEAFDVVFGLREGTTWFLHSRRISNAPLPGMDVRINDDDTPRILTSPVFSPFEVARIQPFYRAQASIDSLSSIFDNINQPVLPWIDDWGNLPRGCSEAFVNLYAEEWAVLRQQELDLADLFNQEITQVLESLHDPTTNVRDAIICLSTLYKHGALSETQLNRNFQGRTNKTVCRDRMNEQNMLEPAFIEWLDTAFVNFLQNAAQDDNDLWSQFNQNIHQFDENNQFRFIESYGSYRLKVIEFSNDEHQYLFSETYTLESLFNGGPHAYLAEETFDRLQNIDSNGRLLRVGHPCIVLRKSTANRLAKLGADLFPVPIEDAFFGEVGAESETVEPPASFAYLPDMIRAFIPQADCTCHRLELNDEGAILQLGPNGVRFHISTSDNKPRIQFLFARDERLSVDQHEWLMGMLRDKIHSLIPDLIEEYVTSFLWPWSWNERSNAGDSSDGKLKFAMRYCTITELEQITAVNTITTYEHLAQHLEDLIQLYSNKSPLLQYSIKHAYVVYEGLASIRTSSRLFTNISFEPRLDKQVWIPHWMLQKQRSDSLNQQTLGETFLVSEREILSFRRFTHLHPDEETYDIDVDNVVEILHSRLFDEENGWCSPDVVSGIWTFENILIDSNGDYHNICLWKVHALHILAFLRSIHLGGED
jgi:hypothetical protein